MPKLFIGDGKEPIKVACKACIDGHRASSCLHLDRILVQVRQLGRPGIRARCTHAKPGEGSDRCKDCFPTIAYVVPGHNKGRGCGCHTDPDVAIRNWQKASQEEVDQHISEREKRKEVLRHSATSRTKAEEIVLDNAQSRSKACCSSRNDSVVLPDILPRPQQVPAVEPASSGQSAYLTPDHQDNARQLVAPWSITPNQANGDNCVCGDSPGQCTCIGCGRHANNQATLDFVNETWASQVQDHRPLRYPPPPSPVFDHAQAFEPNPALLEWLPQPQDLYSPIESQNVHQSQYQAFAMVGPCPICLCGKECTCASCPCQQQRDAGMSQPVSPVEDDTSIRGSCCNAIATPAQSINTVAHEPYLYPPRIGAATSMGASLPPPMMDPYQVLPLADVAQPFYGQQLRQLAPAPLLPPPPLAYSPFPVWSTLNDRYQSEHEMELDRRLAIMRRQEQEQNETQALLQPGSVTSEEYVGHQGQRQSHPGSVDPRDVFQGASA